MRGGTYNNEQYKIYKIVEGVSVHDIVHDIYPSFQGDDLVVETEKTHAALKYDKHNRACTHPQRRAKNTEHFQFTS